MIVRGEMMIDQLSDEYASPACKLGRMVEEGSIIRLKRGIYETDLSTPPYLVAHYLCEPSYISFEYALSRHSIIPERVVSVTCATCGKRKTKVFDTPLGRFTYRDIPAAAFGMGVEIWSQGGRDYPMATPAKAVCDKLYEMPPTRTFKALEDLMFDDLRFDEEEILALDPETIATYGALYRSTTIRTLARYLEVEP